MSSLPNYTAAQVKVYPNEYITNVTMNRAILRLLQNDIYLETLTSGALNPSIVTLSAAVDDHTVSIDALTADVATISGNYAKFVSPPATTNSPGAAHQLAVSGQYLYAYSPTGSGSWGRIAMSYNF